MQIDKRDSATFLSRLQEIFPVGYSAHDVVADQIIAPTGFLQKLFGLPTGLHGKSLGNFTEYIHPDDRERFYAYNRTLYSDPQDRVHQIEIRLLSPKGEQFYLQMQGVVMRRSAEGQPTGTFGTITNLTKTRQLETRLNEERERMEQIKDNRVKATTAACEAFLAEIERMERTGNANEEASLRLMSEHLDRLAQQVDLLIEEVSTQTR